MKKFTIKLLLFLSPVLFILFIYAYKDPFKVLYHYSAYYSPVDSEYFFLNDDYTSIQTLIQNYPANHYDSYILGSSRANGYRVSEWAKYIHSTHCFHVNVAWESLYGVEKKLEFLDKNKYPINNVIIAIDNELLSVTKNGTGHLRLKHPATSGQTRFQFQTEFLKDFFDKDFLATYFDLLFSGRIKPYMLKNETANFEKFKYDVVSNESTQTIESEIEKDSAKFYNYRKEIFYTRDSIQQYEKPVIGREQKMLLTSIKNILIANHTNYRIIINPLYDQLKFNPEDLKFLQELFDAKYVCDFSGINSITQNKYNYYETSHFRPRVNSFMLNQIYNER